MSSTHRFRRLLSISLILFASLFSGGCRYFFPAYSPLPAFSPAPARLGGMLPQLEQRWPQVSTFQAQGSMNISGQGILGRVALGADLLYKYPYQMRLRASRGPLTVLEVLQSGDQVAIIDNTNRRVFMGSVDELKNYPGVTGGLEPLEIAHAMLVGETFIEALHEVQASGAEPQGLLFHGDYLVFSRKVPASDGQGARLEEFTIRRSDGLIQSARLVQTLANGQQKELDVAYERWAVTAKGRPYPSYFVIDSTQPRTRLRVSVDQAAANPALGPEVFTINPSRYQLLPLRQLLQAPAAK